MKLEKHFFYDLYENIGQSVINDLCNRGVLENNEEIELEEFLEALKGFSLKNENDLKEFKEILSVKVESLKDDEAQKAEATFKRRRL